MTDATLKDKKKKVFFCFLIEGIKTYMAMPVGNGKMFLTTTTTLYTFFSGGTTD